MYPIHVHAVIGTDMRQILSAFVKAILSAFVKGPRKRTDAVVGRHGNRTRATVIGVVGIHAFMFRRQDDHKTHGLDLRREV